MVMKYKSSAKSIPAGEFKAKCLKLLDQVEQTGRPLVVTKRGRAVARVVPMMEPSDSAPLSGLIEYQADLLAPIDESWDTDR